MFVQLLQLLQLFFSPALAPNRPTPTSRHQGSPLGAGGGRVGRGERPRVPAVQPGCGAHEGAPRPAPEAGAKEGAPRRPGELKEAS